MTKRQLFYPDYTVGPDFKIKMSLLNKLIPRSVPPLIKHYENDDNELSLLEEKLTLQDEFYPGYTVGPDVKIKTSLLNKFIPRSVPQLIKYYENDDNELSLPEEKLTLQDELKQIKIIIDNNYDTSEIPFDTEDEWNYIMIENAKYPDADEEGELDIDDYSDDDDKGYKK